jgi:hypothetical protein
MIKNAASRRGRGKPDPRATRRARGSERGVEGRLGRKGGRIIRMLRPQEALT